MVDRRNINRGFKKLEAWKASAELYVLTCRIFFNVPFELKKVTSNITDASHSIGRNIAEGYGRKGLKEYLNFLNMSLGSCAELHSSYITCHVAGQVSDKDYEELDKLHFKVENHLIRLIESLQLKMNDGSWQDSFVVQQSV